LPLMVDMQAKFLGERPWTLTLAIPVGDTATVVEGMWSVSIPLELVFELGGSFPIDTAAVGRSILAYFDHDEVAARVGAERVAALRPDVAGDSRGARSRALQRVACCRHSFPQRRSSGGDRSGRRESGRGARLRIFPRRPAPPVDHRHRAAIAVAPECS